MKTSRLHQLCSTFHLIAATGFVCAQAKGVPGLFAWVTLCALLAIAHAARARHLEPLV